MPGEGLDLERTLCPICAPSHAGQASGPGGGGSLPTTLYQVLYVCHMVGVEQGIPGHRYVRQGCGEAAETTY